MTEPTFDRRALLGGAALASAAIATSPHAQVALSNPPSAFAPAPHLHHRGARDPFAELYDRAGLFRDGDELRRRHRLAIFPFPSHERFEADDLAPLQLDDRLVVKAELAAVERSGGGGALGDGVAVPVTIEARSRTSSAQGRSRHSIRT